MVRICRFAPSPTGFLHVGNIRAAIINYLFVKKHNGKFLLRFDDTDESRVKDEYRDMIIQDFAWLGLEYDNLTKQSDFLDKYEAAKNKLITSGRLYECFETAEELNIQRKSQIRSGMRPIYDRSALNLTSEQKDELRKSGVKSYYRFLLEDKEVSWDDKIRGKISYQGRHFSDPVVIRENGIPTYTFCSVVDDIDFGVTDIIRGEDHITNTAIQIQIFESLGGKIPEFAHLALIKAKDSKISKREGGFDIKTLREEGFEAMSLINLLAQIGSSKSINIYKNSEDLVKDFALENFSKSATNYDINELKLINQKLIQSLEFSEVKDRIKNLGIQDETFATKFWECISPNISFFNECKEWLEIINGNFKHKHNEQDQDFLKEISKILPEDTTQENCWQDWIAGIKKISDRKGKNLFMPIRLALTGKEHGPELKLIINLISREKILERLT